MLAAIDKTLAAPPRIRPGQGPSLEAEAELETWRQEVTRDWPTALRQADAERRAAEAEAQAQEWAACAAHQRAHATGDEAGMDAAAARSIGAGEALVGAERRWASVRDRVLRAEGRRLARQARAAQLCRSAAAARSGHSRHPPGPAPRGAAL